MAPQSCQYRPEHVRLLHIDIYAFSVHLDFQLYEDDEYTAISNWMGKGWDNKHEYRKQLMFLLEWIVKRLRDSMKDRELKPWPPESQGLSLPPPESMWEEEVTSPPGAKSAVPVE